jgi:hypothetical protein
MILSETIVGDVLVRIRLEDDVYLLSYGDLVVYEPGRRHVRGRWMPYQFRSVEQLRYDFEQDVAGVA